MKKVFKLLSIIIICLIILILSIYFIATSSFFIRNVLFPVTGKIFDIKINVEKIVVSPFAGDFEFYNLEVISQDGYSIKVKKYKSNINLFNLYKRVITINNLNLKDTDITIVQELSLEKKEIKKEEEPNYYRLTYDDLSDLIILDINNIKIDNFNIKYTAKRSTTKESSVMELSNYSLVIPQLKTGKMSIINYKGTLKTGPESGKQELTGEISGDIHTKISNNSLPPFLELNLKAKINEEVTPIKIVFESNKNKKLQTCPFKINMKLNNLSLLPLFKVFIGGSYSEGSGTVNNLSLNIVGSDLINPDINKNIEGVFNAEIVDLYLPIELAKYGPVKLIFLPVEILSNINQYTKTDTVPSQLDGIFKSANSITSGLDSMHFSKNIIDISLDKGKVIIKKLDMTGGMLRAVRSISIKGNIDLHKEMDIDTQTSFVGVIVPIRITGTIDNPKPDLTMLLPGMVFGTANNILGSGVDIGKGITMGTINVGKGLGAALIGESDTNTSKQQPETAKEDKKENDKNSSSQ